MRNRKKREAQALLGAILVHVLLFLVAALGGFFTFVHRVTDTDPAEVEVYDLSAGDPSGGAGGGSPPVREDERKALEAQGVQGEASKGVISGRGGEGTGRGVGKGAAEGPGAGPGNGAGMEDGNSGISPDPPPLPPPPPPPKERVEASLASEAAPVYPPDLIEAEVEGSVTIRINVAEDGEIESVRVISSSGYSGMDHAAVEAGWHFRFHPGDGGRKGTWTKTFRFRLN